MVAILRATTAERFGAVTDVLVECGIKAVEFTFTSEGVTDALRAYAEVKPDDVALGAGTVLTAEQARQAVDAGASFLISPSVELEVIEAARDLGVPVVPGAFSPTEIHTAFRAGAHAVKVFPAGVLGPSYLKAVAGPFPAIPLVPTGGVDVENARAYLDAGARAVGLGSPLIGDAADPDGDLGALRVRAHRLLEVIG